MTHHLFRLTVLCTLCAPLPALASVSVSPLLFDYELEEREIIQETITLKNTFPTRVARVYASVNEITVGSGGEIKEFVPPSMSDNQTSVTSWIEISRGRIELQPGETKEIPVTIRISPNAEPGSYHAFIGFGTGKNRHVAEQQVLNGTAEGVLVKISLDEKRNDFLRLANFFIERFIISGENEALRYEITNPSDKPIVPTGEVILYNGRGEEVGAVPVNPDGASIEAGKTAEFEDTVPMPEGFGRHKAYLSVEYGEHQLASIHDTAFFYVIPIKQLVIIFVTVLAIAVVLTIIISRRYGDDDDYDPDDGEAVMMFDRRGERSEDAEHDVNLKHQQQQ